jgi:pimeloyl-ACP methyl ester carboxylesterase
MSAFLRLRRALLALCLVGLALPAFAAPPALPPMQTTEVYGQSIRYYDVGHGPVLVLVHGLGSSASFDWGPVIPELAKHYRVLAMDQLGFGSSAKPLINYGVQTWADMLGGFLKERGVTRFALAGESLGGWISGFYTIEAKAAGLPVPERLILVDAAGHRALLPAPGARGTAMMPVLSLASVREGLSRFVFHDPNFVTPEFAEQTFRARLAEGSQYTQDSFWRNAGALDTLLDERAREITVPTLVVWGAEDRLIPIGQGRDYADKIPGARLAVIAEAGHAPAIEKPREFLDAVLPFLAEGR